MKKREGARTKGMTTVSRARWAGLALVGILGASWGAAWTGARAQEAAPSGKVESMTVIRIPLGLVTLDPATANLQHNLKALGLTPAATTTFVSGNGTTGADGSLGVSWRDAGVTFTSTPNVVCSARFENGDAAFCRVSGVDTVGASFHFGRFDGLGQAGRIMFIAMGLAQ